MNENPSYSNTLDWLLEPDFENPGVRYFALTDLLEQPNDQTEVISARQDIMRYGPVPVILANQTAEGYWVKPGPGYWPKYQGTVWQVIFLAQFGADGSDAKVRAGCEYVFEHHISKHGGLSADGKNSGLIHCLQGNLCAALIDLGWIGDDRLKAALDWLARSITGANIAPATEKTAQVRFYRSGNSAPGFACSANDHLPCAWGAVKAMLALSKVPPKHRSPAIEDAIQAGVDFLFSIDPATADYPKGYSDKPNLSWFRFGYPIGYVTDVLQILETLAALGFGDDPRLENARDLLLSKQDRSGRWKLEYTYNGKTWVDVEQKKQPSKWVSLRALRVLKATNQL